MAEDVFSGKPGAYSYTQSELGKTAEGVLALGQGVRSPKDQQMAGGSDRGKEDDGSHLIASRFKGSSKEKNIEAFHRSVNRGSYKRMENRIAKLAARRGNLVHMKVASHRRAGLQKPDAMLATNTLRRADGSVDREHRSFIDLSKDDQVIIHKELQKLDIPIHEVGVDRQHRELAKQYANKHVEIPLGMADVFWEKGRKVMVQKEGRKEFESRLKVDVSARNEAQPQASQKNDQAKQRTIGDEGGREMGGRASTEAAKAKQAKPGPSVSENVRSLDAVFAARKQGMRNAGEAAGKNAGKKGCSSIVAGLTGCGQGRGNASTGGRSVGGGKGFGGRGNGGGKGFGCGKGFGGGRGGR